ncbi:MAG TPA: HDIG domain-containing protein [Feifaniaceae bacterium]|nr:HDIG domain-containing protein [Feifaniaceae bacterium]
MGKKEDGRERVGLLSVLSLALVLVLFYGCAVAVLSPKRYDIMAGMVAPETIEAPRSVEDKTATETLKDAAREATKAVYRLDSALIETYTSGAAAFFAQADEMRQSAQALLVSKGQPAAGTTGLTAEQWKSALSVQELDGLLSGLPVTLTQDEGWQILSAKESELLRLQDAVLSKLTTALKSGLEERALPARKTAYIQELNATTLPDTLKAVGKKLFDTYLQPTFVVDEEATARARELAAESVQPVIVKRGEVIVHKGEQLTAQQFKLLRELELVQQAGADVRLRVGLALLFIFLFASFAVFLLFYNPKVLYNKKSTLILAFSLAASALLAVALHALDPRVTTGLVGVMFIALLLDSTTAMAANVLIAVCLGVMAGGQGEALMGFEAMTLAVSMLVGGQVAVFALRSNQKRGSIIAAGALSGAAAALVTVAAYVMAGRSAVDTLIAAAWAVGSSTISAVLVVGSLSLWENLFDVATSARLAELSNANHPLLRQLMTEAPGTYHHSMMTAALSESAAEAIGADALLARVGAYYHDVGKLRRPLYFKENQKPGENVHDTLPASESAAIILAHQKDSVVILNKHKMPAAVVQIAFEHHGNSLVAYFYHKAAKESGKPPAQKNFRYPGARPSTKESAIVHLADSCEAAVRAMENPSREDVEETVDRIIKGKMDDGQLSASPLNFREISVIEQSFLRTFNGLMHDRIAYPELNRAGEN